MGKVFSREWYWKPVWVRLFAEKTPEVSGVKDNKELRGAYKSRGVWSFCGVKYMWLSCESHCLGSEAWMCSCLSPGLHLLTCKIENILGSQIESPLSSLRAEHYHLLGWDILFISQRNWSSFGRKWFFYETYVIENIIPSDKTDKHNPLEQDRQT